MSVFYDKCFCETNEIVVSKCKVIVLILMFSQVRRLVVVESTALFDTAGIDLKPHKAVKVKTKGTKTHTHTAGKEQNRCNKILSKYVCLFVCVQKVAYLEFP